ncbi:MAG: pilin [Candidatus Pacebacteria bacterium]|nr:pilin [Candidatus Paceibacterota bacterium]
MKIDKKKIISLVFLTGTLFLMGSVVFADSDGVYKCVDGKISEYDNRNGGLCKCPDKSSNCELPTGQIYDGSNWICVTNHMFGVHPSCNCDWDAVRCQKDIYYMCMLLKCDTSDGWYGDDDRKSGDDDNDDDDSNGSDNGTTYTGKGLVNPIGISSLSGLLIAVAKWLEKIGLILAPLFFVIGGIMFITANGDTKKIDNGKKLMFYTAIGIIVILLAESLATALQNFIK